MSERNGEAPTDKRVLPRAKNSRGPLRSSACRRTKSSSLVTIHASVSLACCHTARSDMLAIPRSLTWYASCPSDASHRANAGGRLASTRNFTARRQ